MLWEGDGKRLFPLGPWGLLELRVLLQNPGFGTQLSMPPVFSHLTDAVLARGLVPGGSQDQGPQEQISEPIPEFCPSELNLKLFQLVPPGTSPSPGRELSPAATSCLTSQQEVFSPSALAEKGIWARGMLPTEIIPAVTIRASPSTEGLTGTSRLPPAQRRGIHLPTFQPAASTATKGICHCPRSTINNYFYGAFLEFFAIPPSRNNYLQSEMILYYRGAGAGRQLARSRSTYGGSCSR